MLEIVQKLLQENNQSQLLDHYNDLSEVQKTAFLESVSKLNFDHIKEMFKIYDNRKEIEDKLDDLVHPIPQDSYESITTCSDENKQKWINEGLKEIADSKVAVILMAGGQGTRLGVPYPKGMFNVNLKSKKSLYQIKAERIKKLQELACNKTGQNGSIIWYIMTSESTMEQTQEFFKENEYFGLNCENVQFFEQYTLPCMDFDGKILLSAKNKIAQSPDGNGGLYRALVERGMLTDMQKRNIKHIHTIGVDNILTKIADPAFIGLCNLRKADCAAKVVRKSAPNEAVGVVCKVNDVFQVVEYSEVSVKTSSRTDKDGNLVFNAGNICNHYFNIDFLIEVCKHAADLPLHIAKKKIPFVSTSGEMVRPSVPNGIKMEKFVFDVFKFAKRFLVLDVPRQDEFAPLKNAEGAASCTPLHSRRSLAFLHHRWLIESGAIICSPTGEEIFPPKRFVSNTSSNLMFVHSPLQILQIFYDFSFTCDVTASMTWKGNTRSKWRSLLYYHMEERVLKRL